MRLSEFMQCSDKSKKTINLIENGEDVSQKVDKLLSNSVYLEPEILPENRKLIDEVVKKGGALRKKNLRKKVYKNALGVLNEILDESGRASFEVTSQTAKQKLSELTRDYGIKFIFNEGDDRPYVEVGKDRRRLVSLLNDFIEVLERRPIKKESGECVFTEEQVVIINKILQENESQSLKERKRNLFLSSKGDSELLTKDVLKTLSVLLKNELSYLAIKIELQNQPNGLSESEKLMNAVGDVAEKFKRTTKEVRASLDRNHNLKNLESGKAYNQLVFSINPKDIVMMSTQKDWISCTQVGCENFETIEVEIGNLSIVVYGTSNGDLENPVNRVLLKPYLDKDKTSIVWSGQCVYGESDSSLLECVNDIVISKFNRNKKSVIYNIQEDLYSDGYDDSLYAYANRKDILAADNCGMDISQVKIILERFSNDEEIKEYLLCLEPMAIKYIENPSEKLQLVAISLDEEVIEYIKNPSEAVQVKAVSVNPFYICEMKNPSEKVQIAAVSQDGMLLQYIKNPSEKVQMAAISDDESASVIQYIEDPSEKVQIAAVSQDGMVIQYIENPSEAVRLAAVSRDGDSIQYIKNPSEVEQLAAVSDYGHAIQYIEGPSEKVQIAAVSQDGVAIRYIGNPSEAVQLSAVRENAEAIEYIENPSDKVLAVANSTILKSGEDFV